MTAPAGQSPAFLAALAKARTAATSRARVLLAGETGTGKETFARLIHHGSGVSGSFVALNCASLSPELLESELFGHVKGSFTSALRDHGGLVREAEGGTLFLDEIAEMPSALQAKLLRFVETGEFRRVGAAKAEQADIRIICATHQPLKERVKLRQFREDLYYRLAVITIDLPPLRARVDDIVLLARQFLADITAVEKKPVTRLSTDALAALMNHDWPGNIRELHNALYQAVVMHGGEELTAPMLALTPRHTAMALMRESTKPQPLWRVEQVAIEAAIGYCNGNIPQAARLLEVSPSTLYRRRETVQEQQAADF